MLSQTASWSRCYHAEDPLAGLTGAFIHIHTCSVSVPKVMRSREVVLSRLRVVGASVRRRKRRGAPPRKKPELRDVYTVHRCTRQQLAELDRIMSDYPDVTPYRIDVTIDLCFDSDLS